MQRSGDAEDRAVLFTTCHDDRNLDGSANRVFDKLDKQLREFALGAGFDFQSVDAFYLFDVFVTVAFRFGWFLIQNVISSLKRRSGLIEPNSFLRNLPLVLIKVFDMLSIAIMDITD